ncbi:16870_t:CDS:2 [Funneliformis geosporum]|uniref:DNA-directed RNA polymerase II subunit RPB9 n=1 Tax=Funneliformis geosporum TaxID=1117311 RepID=A0A9W4WSK3_9GLOM|nr:10578_t:CDS:2 [Funneliformis geosporum]CAI2186808.1 16870_t:CDS:2 [Funneliformis geosporum]
MATFKFCKLCSNLLYPREDKEAHKLFYACRNCIHQEETENKCVYRNEIMHSSNETTTIIRDIACDPTLARTEKECPECGYTEAVYFEQQSRRSGRSDTKMMLYYACANTECGYRWTDLNVENKPKPPDEENISEGGYIEEENYMNEMLSYVFK